MSKKVPGSFFCFCVEPLEERVSKHTSRATGLADGWEAFAAKHAFRGEPLRVCDLAVLSRAIFVIFGGEFTWCLCWLGWSAKEEVCFARKDTEESLLVASLVTVNSVAFLLVVMGGFSTLVNC